MDRQKIFNKVARHLIKQGERAVNERGTCQYRDRTGKKCAFGILIRDDEYDPGMEGGGVERLFKLWSPALSKTLQDLEYESSSNDLEFFRQLQMVHDSDTSWKETGIKTALTNFAKRFDLKYGILNLKV